MVKTKRKKKSKSRKKSEKIVHQVYGIFDDGVPLEDIDVFYENVTKTEKFCTEKGYEYKMWDLKKCNSLISKYFYIKDDCMIYQVGTDPHGTLNTGEHGGVGFVNLSKKNLLCTTPYIQKWYKLWDRYLYK